MRRIAVVGGGFIGLEVAATTALLRLDVTLVVTEDAPALAQGAIA